MIATIYRASFMVPEEVYQKHGHTEEYGRLSLVASKDAVASGQNAYSGVEEWAEFHSKARAELFYNYWNNWCLDRLRQDGLCKT